MQEKTKSIEKIYYIGFNAGNIIGNECFFEGSITIYPTGEKGNIYYSKKFLGDINNDEEFLNAYKKFVYLNAKSIQKHSPYCKFIFFNPKIKSMLADIHDLNVIEVNNETIINSLNDKFATRNLVKSYIPTLKYILLDGEKLDYNFIKNKLMCDRFVIQTQTGSGGNGTYFIDSPEKLIHLKIQNSKYCISKYEEHIPLNITIIIGDKQTLFLPISAQLISKKGGTFKYIGGDFIYPQSLSYNVKSQIYNYSKSISENIKKIGYRGIFGIDYILCKNEEIKFMEINPRLQSSSFLISNFLQKNCNTSIAQLHYMAITGQEIFLPQILQINQCFLNCSLENSFDEFNNFQIVNNGYFKDNPFSIYRKVFNYSVLLRGDFEKMQKSSKSKGNNQKLDKIKICLISEEYPDETNFGGIATYQKRIAIALTQLGHKVTVIARALHKEQNYFEHGVNVIRIVKNNTDNLVKDYSDYRIRICEILKDLVQKNMIDILEVPDWGAEAIFYAREKKIPIIVKMHTPLCIWSQFNKNGLGKGIQQKMLEWEKELVERADKVISCTQILKDMLYPAMNLDKNINIEVIPNPANVKDFYPINGCHKNKNILYCGSLEQRKGVDILAHAIPKVMQQLQDSEIKFIFVGKDTTRNDKNISMIEYIKQIVPVEYHKNLIFMGQLDNDKLNPIYNNARIGIVPSVFDNLPYVAMEQMLTEMPIIASRNTGVREMISDKISGILYEPLNYGELAQKIVYLYNNPKIAEEMGKNARQEALQKYTPEVIAEKMELIYRTEIDKYKTMDKSSVFYNITTNSEKIPQQEILDEYQFEH